MASFTVPSSGAAGSAISVTDGTRNSGGGAAAPTTTAFYLSVNVTLGAEDILLGSRGVGAVAPGATETATTSLTIPPTTAVGAYYLVAVADVSDAVPEVTETNNMTLRQILIGGDAIVSVFTVPSTGAAGATIVVSDTTKSSGSGSIGATTTRFYLSTNPSLDAGDTLLAESRAVPPLESGASHSGSTTLTLPASIATGLHYVIAKADGNNEVSETSETNNSTPRTIAIGGDLVVSAVTAPASAASGSNITVTDTTANNGAGPTLASQTRFYLSTNAIFDSGDTLLAGGRAIDVLAGAASSTGASTLTLPPGLAAATYYLIAHADGDKTVPETSESNNTMQRAIQIGGDLIVAALTVPAKGGAGQPLTVTETTTNQGAAPVSASVTRFYLSVNASFDSSDTMIGSRDVPGLATGASSAVSTILTIPSTMASGTYFVIAKADADGGVVETSEANNTFDADRVDRQRPPHQRPVRDAQGGRGSVTRLQRHGDEPGWRRVESDDDTLLPVHQHDPQRRRCASRRWPRGARTGGRRDECGLDRRMAAGECGARRCVHHREG